MTIVSYNINGIRAAMRKGLVDWLAAVNADVVCFQEIKATEDQVDLVPFKDLGYHVYFHSAVKKGYSGVAILSKEPAIVKEGVGDDTIDAEGRVLTALFKDFSVVSAYFPSGASSPARQKVKLSFLEHMTSFIDEQKAPTILCGDFNLCHQPLDIHNPQRYKGLPGFTDEERQWMTNTLESGYVDAFRTLHPDAMHQYTWWSYMGKSRERNVGWRIDYILLPSEIQSKLVRATHLTAAKHSDHCPVQVVLELS